MKKILIGAIIVSLAAFATGFFLTRDSDKPHTPATTAAPISSQQNNRRSNIDIKESGDVQEVTKTGTMICLPSNEAGPQATSCALGLKLEDGTQYGLQADDPTFTGSVPTGSRIKVTGTLAKQSNSYGAAGIIKVQILERL